MASQNHPIIAVLLISALTLASAKDISRLTDGDSLQATKFYNALRSNDLPIGLFPRGISYFSFDEATGYFRLRLRFPLPCDAVFETLLRYDSEVTGKISYGKISNLTGISAQELFLWFAVKEIEVDIPSSGLIYFDVDLVSKQLSLSLFETPKDCHFVGNVDAVEETKNDVVLSAADDDRVPISENPSEKFLRKRIVNHEKRAVS